MRLADKVANRFAAALSEDKLKAILLKIRKGATSSLTWGQLGEVLNILDPGWKLEPIVGLVRLFGNKNNDRPDLVGADKDEIHKLHEKLQEDAVTSLPSSPKAGKLYVLDLTLPREGNHSDYLFEFKPWMGSEGWRIMSPSGKSYDALPGQFDFGDVYNNYANRSKKRGKIPTWDAVAWLNKETDWKDQVNKKLDLGEFTPANKRTRDSTGSCPVCFQNIKIKPDIVLHGYRRPGTGQAEGSCFGVGYPPFELSVRGTKDYLDRLQRQYNKLVETLKLLKSGKVELLHTSFNNKEVHKGDPNWDTTLQNAIYKNEREKEYLETLVKHYSKLVSNWKERPLPKEGEPLIDWYYKGLKD